MKVLHRVDPPRIPPLLFTCIKRCLSHGLSSKNGWLHWANSGGLLFLVLERAYCPTLHGAHINYRLAETIAFPFTPTATHSLQRWTLRLPSCSPLHRATSLSTTLWVRPHPPVFHLHDENGIVCLTSLYRSSHISTVCHEFGSGDERHCGTVGPMHSIVMCLIE